jgi:hypothetical protein
MSERMRGYRMSVGAAVGLALLLAGPAAATSGFGCYRVNVGPDEPLAIRAGPDRDAATIATYSRDDAPIIALAVPGLRGEGVQPSLFDIWSAEFDVCVPDDLPVGARRCPVTVFDGGGMMTGWLERRFVDFAECP